MLSTGAFDSDPREIDAWFMFLPGCRREDSPAEDQGLKVSEDLFEVVVLFLCNAVSSVGTNLYKYHNIVRCQLSKLNDFGDVKPDFSPFVSCILDKCIRLLSSDSKKKLCEKSMISIYVCNTLCFLLQTQVQGGLLPGFIDTMLTARLDNLSLVDDDSGEFDYEWGPLKYLCFFSQNLSNKQPCTSLSSIWSETQTSRDHPFVKTLDKIEEMMNHCDGALDEVDAIYSSSIVCTSPSNILSNFPKVITASQLLLRRPFPFLSNLFFLHYDFLPSVAKVWPDIFFSALELANSVTRPDARTDSYSDKEFASVALGYYLKEAPFFVIFPLIFRLASSDLLNAPKLVDILKVKLSQGSFDDSVVSLRLILFWVHQMQLPCQDNQPGELELRLEICFICIKHFLVQVLPIVADFDSSATIKSPILVSYIQEVAKIIFHHPVVTLSLQSPSCCSTAPAHGSLGDDFEDFISSSKWTICPMERNILDMLKTVADYLLALCNGQPLLPKFQAAANKQLLKDFNGIVQLVVSSFKEKFAFCIRNNGLISLLPSYYVLNTLIHYVSPFELLELVRWIFGEVDQTYKVGEKSLTVNGLSIGCYVADNALDLISSYLHHVNGKTLASSVLWDVNWASGDVSLIEEVLYKVIELSTTFKLECADKCLIKAVNTMHVQSQSNVLPLVVSMSRVIMSIPTKILSHCINATSPAKVKLLFLLTELSPLHLTLFGKIFLSTTSSDFTSRRRASEDNHMCAPSDKELIILLPVVLSYLNFSITKFGVQNLKCLEAITSIYSKILLVGFLNWKSFVSRKIFLEEHGEVLPSSTPELVNLFNRSLLGKVIYMLRYYFAFNGQSIDKEKRMELFDSVYPLPSAPDELLECNVSEINNFSISESLKSIIRVIAKISFSRLLLFPDDSFVKSFKTEAGGGLQEMGSSKLSFLKILVRNWKSIVKRFPLVAGKSKDSMSTPCSLLFRHLEVFILRNIAELSMEMQAQLVQLDSFSFPESFFKSSLRYRFADPTTLKLLRGVLTSLHEGKCSYHVLLELLQSHSQFIPSILHSDSISDSGSAFQCGTLLKPLSSILSSHVLSTNPAASDDKHSLQVSLSHSRKLELIKLLRVLYHLSSCQNKCIAVGEGISINSRELLSLILSCYGATMSEIDLEIFKLMNEIVSTEGSHCLSIAEMDYLWGDAASKVRLEKKLKSFSDIVDGETSKEYRKRQFRENLRIDPNLILATVVNFPYDRVASDRPITPKKLLEDNIMDSPEELYARTDGLHRYDPVFLLRFSIHGLSMGYYESLEFAGLGLLALSIMSTSSPDQGIRKLGYEVLERFKVFLEELRKTLKDHANSKFKAVSLLLLLLLYLQNGVTKEGQRIPSVTAMLAAEASLVLLNPSNKSNVAIKEVLCKRESKQLISDPEGKCEALTSLERIPLFHLLYGRNSIKLNEQSLSKEKENVKTDRLWILRLCYAGLVLEEDAEIYENKYSQILSFYSSSFSDNESKKLILQIVKKSVRLPNLAFCFIKRNGLLSWLSSVFCSLHGNLCADGNNQMITCLEIVSDIISQRNIMELLLKLPKNPVKGADSLEGVLEQLSELVAHIYKFLLSSLKTIIRNVPLVNIILQILVTSLSIFQKQEISKPHFNVSHKSLFQLCEVIVDEFGSALSCHSAELVIRAMLTPPPPIVRAQMDMVEFTRFLMLAIPVASKSHIEAKSTIQPSKQSSIEGTLISTLLRWVSSSVVLGRKICKTNTSSPVTVASENLQWLLGNLMVSEEHDNGELKEDGRRNNVALAAMILYLQQLLHGINCNQLLRSVVSSLCLLLLSGDGDSISTGVISLISDQGKAVLSLCSKIRCLIEANPDWRWSFDHELEDFSSAEQTDSQKVDEYNACQSLLLIFQNALRSNSLDLPFMSYQDLVESDVFEWERNTFTAE
ncbi:hypothetical protein C5167_004919 [Papaver somniferum]|uniref:URB1 C-terminal domain-containing protein n=1 Tax=Papaver somniferum TaxID=3469 RepID=A0A4Y7J8Z0_PAPSO|nr:hypothetical protein C5167_004919 [Papaver somniferum]